MGNQNTFSDDTSLQGHDGGLGKGIDLNSEMEQKAYDEMMKEDTSNSKSKKRLASEISASDQMVEEKGSAPSQTRDTNSLANKKLKKTGPKEKEKDGQKSNKNERERDID